MNRYDPYGVPAASNLGRFLQADPIGYDDDLNLYAYVAGDPVNNVDPDGEACVPLVNDASSFCQRADRYDSISSSRGIAGKTTFFSAASAVSRALASVALPFSGAVVNADTRRFLESVGNGLEAANTKRARDIAAGRVSGSSGVLVTDRAFVRFEQGKVQEALGALGGDVRSRVVGNINSLLNGPNLTPGFDGVFRAALDKTKADIGGKFDFGNLNHRVKLGDNLTDFYRSQQMCTGSRIPGVGC